MNSKEKAALVAKAHHLNPVVMIGQKGLTEGVVKETDVALIAHELIKVKIVANDKQERSDMAQKLSDDTNATLLNTVGNIAILYRKKED